MVGSSPQQGAASDIQNRLATYNKSFAGMSLPALEQALSQITADFGAPGQEPSSVAALFKSTRAEYGKGFDLAEKRSTAAIAQQAKQMGMDFRPDALAAAQGMAKTGLEAQRADTMAALTTEEANMGLEQTDALLARMGNIEKMLQGGIAGYAGAASSFLPDMSKKNPWMSALGGAASGAAMGTEISPGYGTLIGAVVGGAAGYFGNS